MIEQDKQIIIKVIRKHLPDAQIYLFGSRARKDNTPVSDIDIAVDNKLEIDTYIISCIKEELEESIIPFTIDVVDLNNIDHNFKNQILGDLIKW